MAAHVEGARVEVESEDGWLRIIATTDDSIKGWALSIDGKDHPTTDDALRLRVLDLEGALRYYGRFGPVGKLARKVLGDA